MLAHSLDIALGFARARAPHQQAFLDDADQHIERQSESGQHQDAGKHGIDVEYALGLQDQVAYAARRTQVLPPTAAFPVNATSP